MRWTKKHSQNAVAAKERIRIGRAAEAARADARPTRKVRLPRKARPDFIIRIESARGERMQIAVHRFFGRVRTSDGQSARQFCRGLEQLLTKSA
jgi:hypothetical protein